MRILFLSDNFPPETNAPASRTFEHTRRWVQQGHEVTVITGAPNFPQGKVYPGYRNAWYQVEEMAGVRVVRVKTYITANEGFAKRTLDYLSFMVTGFLAGLFQRRPDVIVGTSPQFFTNCAAWLLSVFRWRPFVFELRDLWPASIVTVGAMQRSLAIRALEKLELFLYRRAAAIVPVTHAFKADLVRRGIDPAKIHVVINGVDLSRYAPQPRDPGLAREHDLQDKFVVGYIGTHGMAPVFSTAYWIPAYAGMTESESPVNDYYDMTLKQARLARLQPHPGFTDLRASLEDRAALTEAFAQHRPQRVINLAAQAGVRYSLQNPHAYVDSKFHLLTYIDDIVEGVIRVLDRVAAPNPAWSSDNPDSATSLAPYRLYNIGSHRPIELLRYIAVLEDCLGRAAIKNLLPMQLGDVPDTYADVEALIEDVGYQPTTAVEDGIARFVAWYRQYYRV